MHSLFALTIFVAIFSLAECKKYHPYTIPKKGCSAKMAAGMKSTIMEAKCQPRPTLVELAPLEGYEFYPPLISVNQCIGFCANNACLPDKNKTVTRYIRQIPTTGPRKGFSECAVVQVEEHESCSCMCHTMETDCDGQQNFDKQRCACKCKNHEMHKTECEKVIGMKWIEDICECKCMMMRHECTSGTMWDNLKCKCV